MNTQDIAETITRKLKFHRQPQKALTEAITMIVQGFGMMRELGFTDDEVYREYKQELDDLFCKFPTSNQHS